MKIKTMVFALAVICLSYTFTSFKVGSAKEISHDEWDKLLKKNVTEDGIVNYRGFQKDSAEVNKYLNMLSANPPDETTWSKQEQMAYWINAYNAFTIKLILKYYPLKTIKDIGGKIQVPLVNSPWDIKFIKIGSDKLDLSTMENEKIRKAFNEPLVHFCIVCASKSCPKLRNEAYSAAKLKEQLPAQAKAFLNDAFRNKITADQPKLSKIMEWYGMDFPKGEKFIEFLNQYSRVQINKNAKISYLDYDWNLNE